MDQDDDYCSPKSAKLFQTVLDLGYEIFEPRFPLKKMRGCKNKFYEDDLLLIEKEQVTNLIKEKKVELQNMNVPYEIEVYDDQKNQNKTVDFPIHTYLLEESLFSQRFYWQSDKMFHGYFQSSVTTKIIYIALN